VHLTLRLEVLQVDEGVALVVRQVLLLRVRVRRSRVPAQTAVHAVHARAVHMSVRKKVTKSTLEAVARECGVSFYIYEESERWPQTVLLLESSLAACVRCVLPIVYASADRQTHTRQPAPTKLARLLAHWVPLRLCTDCHQGC